MPTPRSVADIKANLLRPALTSHFEVRIPIPAEVKKNVIEKVGLDLSSVNLDQLNLLCSEVSLPGSSLATLEINNDYTGVTERHAHRRIYDDRIDFTFYVDAEKYLPIIFFESWIKYIVGESDKADQSMRGVSSRAKNYFYRVRWPDNYVADQGLQVIKFERDYSSTLVYDFVRAYPISIQSMPVSYDASNLLKCTVSMTYIRYVLTGSTPPADPKPVVGSPQEQAQFNANPLFTNPQFVAGGVPNLPITTGAIPQSAANAAGNTVDKRVEAGLPYVGRNVGPIASFSGI